MILVDTDVLIDYLAGVPKIVEALKPLLLEDQVATTVITAFELLSGLRKSRRAEVTKRLLSAIPVLPLDALAAERAAAVRRELESSGHPIGMADSLIAGIALQNRLGLFTRNRKHFQRIEGLKLTDV
jgi:tRNA(fMet)-specific endonuclease VapC